MKRVSLLHHQKGETVMQIAVVIQKNNCYNQSGYLVLGSIGNKSYWVRGTTQSWIDRSQQLIAYRGKVKEIIEDKFRQLTGTTSELGNIERGADLEKWWLLTVWIKREVPMKHLVLCCAKLLQSCPTLCDPMDCSRQAPLSVGFSR